MEGYFLVPTLVRMGLVFHELSHPLVVEFPVPLNLRLSYSLYSLMHFLGIFCEFQDLRRSSPLEPQDSLSF